MASGNASEGNFEKIDFESLINKENYIDSGRFGAVYGPFTWYRKKVALKHSLIGEDGRDKFIKKVEAKKAMWTSMKHKHLIEIHYVTLKEHSFYLLMECASGGSLRQVLKKYDHEVYQQMHLYNVSNNWARQIAEGMLYLHNNNIVHRDLKSSNVVLMEPFEIANPYDETTLKITDFDNAQEHTGTVTMSFKGTCTHMAPEVRMHEHFSKGSDVWSYGVLVWEMLTCKLPHEGQPPGLLMQTDSRHLKPSIPESIPKEFCEFLHDCWQEDTKSRLRFNVIIERLNNIRENMYNFLRVDNSTRVDNSKMVSQMMKGEMSAKTTYQKSAKGPLAIGECSQDGKYILLENTGRKDEFLGNWSLTRIIDGRNTATYRLSESIVLLPTQKIKVWSKGTRPFTGASGDIESDQYWGVGELIITKLLNPLGEDRATHIQQTKYA